MNKTNAPEIDKYEQQANSKIYLICLAGKRIS